jgi:predicted AlkP superfamily pyrophosphatase or phosphodiesterase
VPTKILFIMLDGCRPDALQQANTPYLTKLWQEGAYTWTAQSVVPSVTLPAHSTLFRGIDPARHGIGSDNVYQPSAAAFPSLMEVAMLANRHTAMFYSWEQLRDLAPPGSVKMSWCRNSDYGLDNDTTVARAAAAYLTDVQPDLCFLYMGDIDISGHLYGWMSPPYIETIEQVDAAVGIVLDALDSVGIREQYTILAQADHGGHDTDHGTEMPEDMNIPWILNGPGIKRGHPIQQPVGLVDTPATLAHLLGIERPAVWEGQPVLEALL